MIYAVIMAGGKGERFWPKSRANFPKHLLQMPGDERTLLQKTISRLKGLIPDKHILIITNKKQMKEVKRQIPGIPVKNIIAEPVGRNTACCIGLAASIISNQDRDGIMVNLPADHYIDDDKGFKKTLKHAIKLAKKTNGLITIGIKPIFPSTGYGYIKKVRGDTFKIERFAEKPSINKARKFLKEGTYLWNSGIFIWKASVILDEIKKNIPGLYRVLKKIQKGIKRDKLDWYLNKYYKKMPDISIDYGVMEKAKNGYMVKSTFKWLDLGSWSRLEDLVPMDKDGNIIKAKHIGIDTKNSIIISDKRHLVATSGLKDIIIVHTKDATLVCRKDKAEDVKKLVAKIKKAKMQRFL